MILRVENIVHVQNLPVCFRNLGNTNFVKGIQEENFYIEDIPGLSVDPDKSEEDEDSRVDYCE